MCSWVASRSGFAFGAMETEPPIDLESLRFFGLDDLFKESDGDGFGVVQKNESSFLSCLNSNVAMASFCTDCPCWVFLLVRCFPRFFPYALFFSFSSFNLRRAWCSAWGVTLADGERSAQASAWQIWALGEPWLPAAERPEDVPFPASYSIVFDVRKEGWVNGSWQPTCMQHRRMLQKAPSLLSCYFKFQVSKPTEKLRPEDAKAIWRTFHTQCRSHQKWGICWRTFALQSCFCFVHSGFTLGFWLFAVCPRLLLLCDVAPISISSFGFWQLARDP